MNDETNVTQVNSKRSPTRLEMKIKMVEQDHNPRKNCMVKVTTIVLSFSFFALFSSFFFFFFFFFFPMPKARNLSQATLNNTKQNNYT